MTTDQIGVANGAAGPSADGAQGWGFGVGVQVRRVGLARTVGSYGWDGGLGTSWVNDPTEGLIATILTTDMFTSAFPPPPVIQDFWTSVYAALV
jgi:CubicO group peptidase (beta-lactamase class C family)